jgi:hypothetical protein
LGGVRQASHDADLEVEDLDDEADEEPWPEYALREAFSHQRMIRRRRIDGG